LRLIVIIFAYYYNSINQLLHFGGAGLCKDVKTIRNYENAQYVGVYRRAFVLYARLLLKWGCRSFKLCFWTYKYQQLVLNVWKL